MTIINSPTYTAEVALFRHARVKAGTAATEVDLAGATDVEVGTVARTTVIDDPVSVQTPQEEAVTTFIADAAITAGVLVSAAAGGKVQPSSAATIGDLQIGVARTAAAADGDWVDVLRQLNLVPKA